MGVQYGGNENQIFLTASLTYNVLVFNCLRTYFLDTLDKLKINAGEGWGSGRLFIQILQTHSSLHTDTVNSERTCGVTNILGM
jgi:hypothetical protein